MLHLNIAENGVQFVPHLLSASFLFNFRDILSICAEILKGFLPSLEILVSRHSFFLVGKGVVDTPQKCHCRPKFRRCSAPQNIDIADAVTVPDVCHGKIAPSPGPSERTALGCCLTCRVIRRRPSSVPGWDGGYIATGVSWVSSFI